MIDHCTIINSVPAKMQACLAGACPMFAEMTLPMMTSLTSLGETLALSRAALIAVAANSGPDTDARDPPIHPTGVLIALTMTTS